MFKHLGLDTPLVDAVEEIGYTEPTPIQKEAIPQVLAGRDVVGCAQTGTGKTAAFILPALQRISGKSGIKALVVTPTRELATQIEEVASACAQNTGHHVAAIFGGVAYKPQLDQLRDGVDLLVATPGRLLDMMNRGAANIAAVEIFVLDEADRLLDMGFWPDVKRIIKALPDRRQNLLFSATMSPKVLGVIRDTLNDPISIEVGGRATPPTAIAQSVYPVESMQKCELLVELLKQRHMERVLVFSRTKRRADYLLRVLERKGVSAAAIHSDFTQAQREQALAGFKSGRHRVLVATDIVARGIDIVNVSHVINYDIPDNPEDYVHRIGRTARASAAGTAISLFSIEELGDLRSIEAFLGKSLPCEDLPDFQYQPRYVPSATTRPIAVKRKLAFDGGALRSTRRRRR